MKAKGLIFWLFYNLWRRRMGVFPFGAIFLMAAVLGGFIVSSFFLALGLLFALASLWAYRSGFLCFRPETLSLEKAAPLHPEEKVFVRASGSFEVERKQRYFVDLAAAFEGFETGEKAVMAYVPPSLFWPKSEVGMWYFFFRPEEVRNVELGHLFFGFRSLPALKLICQTKRGLLSLYLASEEPSRLERIRNFILSNAERSSPYNGGKT